MFRLFTLSVLWRCWLNSRLVQKFWSSIAQRHIGGPGVTWSYFGKVAWLNNNWSSRSCVIDNGIDVAETSSSGGRAAEVVLYINPTCWWSSIGRVLAAAAVVTQGRTADQLDSTSSLSPTHVSTCLALHLNLQHFVILQWFVCVGVL